MLDIVPPIGPYRQTVNVACPIIHTTRSWKDLAKRNGQLALAIYSTSGWMWPPPREHASICRTIPQWWWCFGRAHLFLVSPNLNETSSWIPGSILDRVSGSELLAIWSLFLFAWNAILRFGSFQTLCFCFKIFTRFLVLGSLWSSPPMSNRAIS